MPPLEGLAGGFASPEFRYAAGPSRVPSSEKHAPVAPPVAPPAMRKGRAW